MTAIKWHIIIPNIDHRQNLNLSNARTRSHVDNGSSAKRESRRYPRDAGGPFGGIPRIRRYDR